MSRLFVSVLPLHRENVLTFTDDNGEKFDEFDTISNLIRQICVINKCICIIPLELLSTLEESFKFSVLNVDSRFRIIFICQTKKNQTMKNNQPASNYYLHNAFDQNWEILSHLM